MCMFNIMYGHIRKLYNLYIICLQGSAVPPSPCSSAISSFFGANDDCSRAAKALLSGNESALVDLYSGGCPTQFRDFATSCSDVFGDEVNKNVFIEYLSC